ncbi:MAG: hypothetical protein Q9201_003089 [Fulgogasparrea decipioides]
MPSPTSYFGYGSNLWLLQMSLRCPSSIYTGIARLTRYRWIINARGYANIVQTGNPSDVVYGLVYTLDEDDEDKLDFNEGVPYAYTKEQISMDFWSLASGGKVDLASGICPGAVKKELLVYIDRKRVKDARPKAEYVHRINMGVRDAVKIGMPQKYVDDVIRKFIPAETDQDAQVATEKQVLRSEDER